LKQVSLIIKTSIREGDIAARWGGEEMAIYLPEVMVEQAMRVAERIRLRVQSETEPKVTISSGISVWTRNQPEKLTVESIFYKADMALYQAKHGGRNQVKIGN
jgi:diguanylate cyclase (GGDEF)-like protein